MAESSKEYYTGHYEDGAFQFRPPAEESAAFISPDDYDPDGPLPIELEAMLALKREEEDPEESARVAKEEGTWLFGKKDYRQARTEYTDGLKSGCTNPEMLAVLYANRAAVEFRLQNYGRCIRDCRSAVQWNPRHLKAALRAPEAYLKLGKCTEAMRWCDEMMASGGSGEPWSEEANVQLAKLREKSAQMVAEQDAKLRQAKAAARREQAKVQKKVDSLVEIIRSRGFRLHPTLSSALAQAGAQEERVYKDDKGCLHWPVVILYPEHGTSDCLRDVSEDRTISSILATLFDADQDPPSWDLERRYTADNCDAMIELYTNTEKATTTLLKIKPSSTISDAYVQAHKKDEAFLMTRDVISFLVTCRTSTFHSEFIKKYDLVTQK